MVYVAKATAARLGFRHPLPTAAAPAPNPRSPPAALRLERSEGASEAFDMVFNGGKADDITVLCASMN